MKLPLMRALGFGAAATAALIACSSEAPAPAPSRTSEAPLAAAAVEQSVTAAAAAAATAGSRPTWGNGIPLGVMPTREVHAAARAAAPVPALGSGSLAYFGGPVVQNPKIVGVFWGAVDATLTANLPLFYGDITNSNHMDWLSEYNTIGRPASALRRRRARR